MTLSTSTVDVAEWLLNTTRQALEDCGRDPLSRAHIAAGEIAWDDCCGMLVVAPERVFRSVEFPREATDEELCFGGYLATEYVVLLVRCAPTVDDRGRAPSETALQDAYTKLLEDAAVVYNAVTSPIPDYWTRAVPTQTYVGAQGGCIGVETRVIIGLEQDQFAICCAEPAPHVPGDPICRIPADHVSFEPCDDLTSTTVQDAICELADLIPGPSAKPYGAFISTADQETTINTPTAMTLTTVTNAVGISVVSGSEITVAQSGVYQISFSAQLHHRSGGGTGRKVWIWLAHEGVAVPDSATVVEVDSNTYLVASWDFIQAIDAGEQVQIYWLTNNDRIHLEYDPAAPPIPAIPSLIVNVTEVR